MREMIRVISGQSEVLCNVAGRPCIRLPDATRSIFALNSQEGMDWLAAYAFDLLGRALTGGQLSQISHILAGRARRQVPIQLTGPQVWRRIIDEPVAQAVISFMEGRKQQRFDGTMTELLDQLTDRALAAGIPIGKRWPRIANVLSGTLRELELLLLSAGIAVKRRRTGEARRVSIVACQPNSSCDGDDDASSWPASRANPVNTNDLAAADASDDRTRHVLIERINSVITSNPQDQKPAT